MPNSPVAAHAALEQIELAIGHQNIQTAQRGGSELDRSGRVAVATRSIEPQLSGGNAYAAWRFD